MAFDFPDNPTLGQVYIPPGSTVSYEFNSYAWIRVGGGSTVVGDYVEKTGDTMTGFLTLSADPVQPMHAATKQYADTVALPLGGLAGEALVKNPANTPAWGATIDAGNYN